MHKPNKTGIGGTFTAVLAALALAVSACASASDTDDGVVTIARANWDSGYMQAAVYAQLIEELGYEVSDPADNTRDPNGFYPALASGQFDLWANGWFPLHDIYLEGELVTGQSVDLPIEAVGTQVSSGALQGYMIDKATSDASSITSMSSLADSAVAAMFDVNGNGKADLFGCNEGWACKTVIDAHIAEFSWGGNVEQRSGDYSQLIGEDVKKRLDAGQPVLFYAWTPNWTYTAMPPGQDVVWLQSDAMEDDMGTDVVPGLDGCAGGADPCKLGWPVNSIRAVANSDFLDDNAKIKSLLEQVKIPLEDIAAQNAQQAAAMEYSEEQIRADAAKWIADNRSTVDGWLNAANSAG